MQESRVKSDFVLSSKNYNQTIYISGTFKLQNFAPQFHS